MKTKHIKRRVIGLSRAAVIVGVFGLVGFFALRSSHAATYATTAEVETGTLSGNAATASDGTASASSAVKFGTTTPPPPSDMPTTANTGIRPGSTLTNYSGSMNVTTDGTTVSNMNISGGLYITANNVTVDNVKVGNVIAFNRTSGGAYPHPVKQNMRLTNVDVRSIDNLGADIVVIDKARIRGQVDGTHIQLTNYLENGKFWKCENVTIINSYFDPPAPATDSQTHMENYHPMGCVHQTIRNNVFNMTAPNSFTQARITASVFFQEYNNVYNDDVTFDNNWLYGGGFYQIYANAKNMRVTNNKFHSYSGGDIVYPPSDYGTYYPITQSGNTKDGQPFTLPNSQ